MLLWFLLWTYQTAYPALDSWLTKYSHLCSDWQLFSKLSSNSFPTPPALHNFAAWNSFCGWFNPVMFPYQSHVISCWASAFLECYACPEFCLWVCSISEVTNMPVWEMTAMNTWSLCMLLKLKLWACRHWVYLLARKQRKRKLHWITVKDQT